MPKTWGARTGDERQVARRERIVGAAIKVYGEHGYRNTSVKAICMTAGPTERYFTNQSSTARTCSGNAFSPSKLTSS